MPFHSYSVAGIFSLNFLSNFPLTSLLSIPMELLTSYIKWNLYRFLIQKINYFTGIIMQEDRNCFSYPSFLQRMLCTVFSGPLFTLFLVGFYLSPDHTLPLDCPIQMIARSRFFPSQSAVLPGLFLLVMHF